MIEAHLIFNGQSRLLKMFIKGAADLGKPDGLLHTVPCHDVGVNDANVGAGQDIYGSLCKCPPGVNYTVGLPEACATRLPNGMVHINNDDDHAYGCWFSGIADDPNADMSKHGRAGIGIHGGGSDLPNPFAWYQGWEYTFGCLRLQNADNEKRPRTLRAVGVRAWRDSQARRRMALDRETTLNEIEDAFNIHGMSLANLMVASNSAREKMTNIFRELSGYDHAVLNLGVPTDRLGMYYTVMAVVGGSAWTADDYARANVFTEYIDVYSADPEQMPAKIYEAMVKIAQRMASEAAPGLR